MTPGLTAGLAGMEFTGRSFRWEPGFYIRTLTGINSGGELSSTRNPRGRGPGTFSGGNVRDTERVITQTGFIYARSDYELQDWMDQLGGLLAEDEATEIYRWTLFGETRQVPVFRHRSTPIERRRGADPFADYALTLRADDQRIYGDEIIGEWGASVAVVHRGGYPAPVSIEVRGNSPAGYTITGPRGKIVRVARPIVPGEPHLYDGDSGVLRVGGAAQTQGVARSDQIEIPYGAHQFAIDNGCELRVTFPPTWAP